MANRTVSWAGPGDAGQKPASPSAGPVGLRRNMPPSPPKATPPPCLRRRCSWPAGCFPGSPSTVGTKCCRGHQSTRPPFMEVSAVINLYYPLVIVLYVISALWQGNLGHW